MSPVAKRWRRALQGTNTEIAQTIIANCVDKTISCLLRAIDQGVLQLSFTSSSGGLVNLPDDGLGELCGWYNGSDGWRAKNSKGRLVDDFSDLK
jgi:hypothetical protein